MKKHAVLIMYHTDYYILERSLQILDNEHFDIYLHVDLKVKDFDFEKTKQLVKKSQIFFVPRMNVLWTNSSQIACELSLLKSAIAGNYQYYHLISGADMPLAKGEDIYQYFVNSYPKEFVAYRSLTSCDENELERIKYYHFLTHNKRHSSRFIRISSIIINETSLKIQKILKVNRLKNSSLTVRKGSNWFSITDECAKYILAKEKLINKVFKYSFCADELFIQTILMDNKKLLKNINHPLNDETKDTKRCIDWLRGSPYVYCIEDYDELINSDCYFARKFSTKVDQQIIDKIYNHLMKGV